MTCSHDCELSRLVPADELFLIHCPQFACLLFFALQLDRGNIGSALSGGMLKDIHVDTNDYKSAAVSRLRRDHADRLHSSSNGQMLFYVCFLIAELPSQAIGKRIGPDRW